MNTSEQAAVELRGAIDVVEEAYEFMLAYAAQGRQSEAHTEGASAIRGFLERFREALNTFSDHLPGLMPEGSAGHEFGLHFMRDIATVKSAIDLLTESESITSDMIDNTNGMIVMRAFLTDMFFVDQVVLPRRVS